MRTQFAIKNYKLIIWGKLKLHWGRGEGVSVNPGPLRNSVGRVAGVLGQGHMSPGKPHGQATKEGISWHFCSLRWINRRDRFKILNQTREELEEKEKEILVKLNWEGLFF